MKKLNNKGFTLVELVATVVILAIVMGIGSFAITGIIKESKKRDYQLLVKEIRNAVEGYYQECKFVNRTCEDVGTIRLGNLVVDGFLKGNATLENGYNDYDFTLVNPNNNENISECEIKYTYNNGKISVEAVTGGICPTTEDYSE